MNNKLLKKADERSLGMRQWFILNNSYRINIVARCDEYTNKKTEWFITNYDLEWYSELNHNVLHINREFARDLFDKFKDKNETSK